jgi:hypothetical protein
MGPERLNKGAVAQEGFQAGGEYHHNKIPSFLGSTTAACCGDRVLAKKHSDTRHLRNAGARIDIPMRRHRGNWCKAWRSLNTG